MSELKVIEVTPEYYEFIRNLRNDSRVSEGFIKNEYITKAQQIEYMEKHAHEYCVCLCDNVPCGYAGVIDDDIRVATSPEFQKRGVGLKLINFLLEKYGNSIFAKIKTGNEPSIKLFESAGFKLAYYIYLPQ
jgi:GNAT superfamily N-acetyltransferase